MIGRTLSHFRITERLGAGGMGEVYLAEDTTLKRRVALKLLPPDLATDPDRLEQFQREAEALAALNHPNIVTIYSVEHTDGVHFITMEWVDGTALDRLIPADGLSSERVFELALPLVEAVAAAHERGITHRDLKPANVMVGADGRLRVLDFGLAKMTRSADADANLTVTSPGTVMGTVAFMSPEQVQGLSVDHRSDVFSLGVMFYLALTGRHPFEGATWAARASSILRDDPLTLLKDDPHTSQQSGIPAGWRRIVARCLEKSPQARYQRASDLHADLAAARRDIESGSHRPAPVAAPAEQAIAVLPFQNMSADPENEYFSDGIAEEIINALTQIDGLRVAARTSSFSFKGKAAEIREIAQKLNVAHVLEGSVRKAGNRVRVTAQLIEASSGYHLWSERYDRQIEDIFDVQDEIARTIVERLRIALSRPDQRLIKATTTNMEAYQLYLKGRAYLYKRGTWIGRALESFRQAVELDPGYGDAWAGLADAYTTHAYYGFAPSIDTLPRALDAARRAVAIDPGSASAHGALALPALLWERDFGTAEREFQHALAINPAYTQARCWYGLMFLQGTALRLEEGAEEARRAVGFDPLSGYAIACHAYALSHAGRRSEALVQGRLAVQRDPESFVAGWALGNACHWGGQFDEAIAAYERLLAASGRHPWGLSGLAATYASMGKHAEARALHAELLALRASRYVQPTVLAMSASAAGDHEAALEFCRAAVDERDALFGVLGQVFGDLDRVRADPRFAGIVAQFNTAGSAAGHAH